MLSRQKARSEWTVGHDGDFMRGAVVAQSVAHITHREVVVVLDHAEARPKVTKLIERDIAGSKSPHRQLFQRVGSLQRAVVPLMQIKQVDVIHAEPPQTVRDVHPLIRRQDFRRDGDVRRLSRRQPLPENGLRSPTTISRRRVEVRDATLKRMIEQGKGRRFVDLTTKRDAAEADAGETEMAYGRHGTNGRKGLTSALGECWQGVTRRKKLLFLPRHLNLMNDYHAAASTWE